MSVIVIGGMIGAGKTSVAKLLGEELGTEVFFEQVDDNPLLELFYTADEQEEQEKRYPFLLQLTFLSSRFRSIKKALYDKNNVLDRSIYEDWYFCKVNHDIGRISELEFKIYEELLDNMMEELAELPKKAPDLMVYLHGSFEEILRRIGTRGRDFEQDDS
ncbi:MAG TPA: deoxynucleoside kinase, partial [Atopostipes sp.]|nr:deoxynucleoside kinase [Atopostipes sp.]